MKPSEVKKQFEVQGVSIRKWAKDHGFKPRLVYAVLHGQVKGKYGESHKIAVALGLKQDPEMVASK